MQKGRKVARVGYAILGLLKGQAMSGYDVRRQFTSSPMGHYSDSPGAIYPALTRLEADGLVAGRVEGARTLRPRKVYRLTPAGRSALSAWIGETPSASDIVENTGDWMLRLAFATDTLTDAQVVRLLGQIEAACDAYASELQDVRAQMPKDAVFPRLALDHGIASYRATAAWARDGARQLKEKRG